MQLDDELRAIGIEPFPDADTLDNPEFQQARYRETEIGPMEFVKKSRKEFLQARVHNKALKVDEEVSLRLGIAVQQMRVELEEAQKKHLASKAYDEAVQQLKKGRLREQVASEIRAEILQETYKDVVRKHTGPMKVRLEAKLRKELRAELTKPVMDQLAIELKAKVEMKLKEELDGEVRAQLTKELSAKVEAKLATALKPKIEERLRKELSTRIEKERLAKADSASPNVQPETDGVSHPKLKRASSNDDFERNGKRRRLSYDYDGEHERGYETGLANLFQQTLQDDIRRNSQQSISQGRAQSVEKDTSSVLSDLVSENGDLSNESSQSMERNGLNLQDVEEKLSAETIEGDMGANLSEQTGERILEEEIDEDSGEDEIDMSTIPWYNNNDNNNNNNNPALQDDNETISITSKSSSEDEHHNTTVHQSSKLSSIRPAVMKRALSEDVDEDLIFNSREYNRQAALKRKASAGDSDDDDDDDDSLERRNKLADQYWSNQGRKVHDDADNDGGLFLTDRSATDAGSEDEASVVSDQGWEDSDEETVDEEGEDEEEEVLGGEKPLVARGRSREDAISLDSSADEGEEEVDEDGEGDGEGDTTLVGVETPKGVVRGEREGGLFVEP